MKVSASRTLVVQLLLLVVIVLLGVNIVLEKYYKSGSDSYRKELSGEIINKRFLSSLDNYNIDSSWINRRNLSRKKNDSLNFSYKVNVPTDLPVSLLLREIQNHFDTSEVNIFSRESKSRNSTELKISSGGYLKLDALLSYNKAFKRTSDTVGFLLKGIEELNKAELTSLILIPERFAAILIPSKHSQEIYKVLKENRKQTAVLLNDNISELEFKLNTGYSDRRIRNSVISIIRKFYDASMFIIDENSDIYNSDHLNVIEKEFSKRNITLLTLDKFEMLTDDSPAEIISAIKKRKYAERLFVIKAEEFLEMPPLIADLRKTGYKFINPSELAK